MARPTQAAVTVALAAALALSACGRKGPLESPSTATPKSESEKTDEKTKSDPALERVLGKP